MITTLSLTAYILHSHSGKWTHACYLLSLVLLELITVGYVRALTIKYIAHLLRVSIEILLHIFNCDSGHAAEGRVTLV